MTIRKKNKIEAKSSMLLLCATDAEAAFFNQFRKDCRYSNLTVAKASGKTIEKILSEAGSLRNKGKYSSVWCGLQRETKSSIFSLVIPSPDFTFAFSSHEKMEYNLAIVLLPVA